MITQIEKKSADLDKIGFDFIVFFFVEEKISIFLINRKDINNISTQVFLACSSRISWLDYDVKSFRVAFSNMMITVHVKKIYSGLPLASFRNSQEIVWYNGLKKKSGIKN